MTLAVRDFDKQHYNVIAPLEDISPTSSQKY